ARLAAPRAVWVMVPAGVTGGTVDELAARMQAGDIVIDGGNSYYRDDIDRAATLKEKGIHYVDCGTSGGVWGLERGYCLMIGGEDDVVRHLDAIEGAGVAEVWRRGSVVASWLLDLTANALVEDPELATFTGRVSDSGEGRWTTLAAVDESVPAPVISAALFGRFSSQGEADYADKLLSAMRKQFGGHVEKGA